MSSCHSGSYIPIRPTYDNKGDYGVEEAGVTEQVGQAKRLGELEIVKMYDVEVVGEEVMNYEDGESEAEEQGEIVEITEQEAEEESDDDSEFVAICEELSAAYPVASNANIVNAAMHILRNSDIDAARSILDADEGG